MSDSIIKNDKIVVDLYDQKISKLPIGDPDELQNVLIHAAEKLTDGNQAVILEALLNTLVDFYVFDLEPGDDIEDVGFLVSEIEDKVCDAIAFRRSLIDNGAYDISDTEGGLMTEEDDDDENDDLPQPIEPERFTEVVDTPEGKKTLWKIRCPKAVEEPVQDRHVSDPDDVRDKEIPGMMKRFEYDGFEVTVKLVPKTEFDRFHQDRPFIDPSDQRKLCGKNTQGMRSPLTAAHNNQGKIICQNTSQ